MLRTPGDFGKVICSAKNIAGEGKTCIYIIKQRVLNYALVTNRVGNPYPKTPKPGSGIRPIFGQFWNPESVF